MRNLRLKLIRAIRGVLCLLVLTACWSSDNLFITLTVTPISTPTRQAIAVESLYQVGDAVEIVGQGIGAIYVTQNPEVVTRRNRVPNAACYANTRVEILDVERVDDVTYYQITCNNTPGWLAESYVRAVEGD